MKILMINHFTQTPYDDSNGRFKYIADLLKENGYAVDMLTTDFSHSKKKYRVISEADLESLSYNLIMLHEPAYKKNVSLKRFYSHNLFSKNVDKYLNEINKPDLIYCSIPSLDVGMVVAKYCRKYNVKLILDIQDLWPEAFEMVLNIPVLSKILFFPMKKQADYIYSSANTLIALSQTNLLRAKKVNKKANSKIVYLGTDIDDLDNGLEKTEYKHKKLNDELWVGYIGTLGSSYDMKNVLYAMEKVNKKNKSIKLIILGDGPLEHELKLISSKLSINVLFLGRLPYLEAMKMLSQCDIAVNPFKKGAEQSVTNKVMDYAALGLPIVNTLESKEYRKMVEQYNIGVNVECENIKSIYEGIMYLITNQNIRIEMGKNNRNLAEKLFDRKRTYKEILNAINEYK